MRAHGSVDTVPGADPADHLCWVYEAAGPLLPERPLAFYDAATQRALGAGYRGLRVIAEVSDLAADPAQRADLVRWEHVADAYAAQGPGFSAMCVYRADLGQDVLAGVAAVHPLVRGPEVGASFRLFADGDRLVLAGTVDSFSSERLERVLAAAATGDVVVLDVSGLEFVDVGGCRVLARCAAALSDRSVAVHVTGASPLLRRLWRLLCFDRVAPLIFLEPTA